MLNVTENSEGKINIISVLLFVISLTVCLLWLGTQGHLSSYFFVHKTLFAGLTICSAAFVLVWAAEFSRADIPQSLQIAIIALIVAFPEYAVDVYYAWTAGKYPAYNQFVLANMTGANKILIGAGWTAVFLFYVAKSKKSYFAIHVKHRIELLALILASVYAFIISAKGSLTIFDSVFLITIFIWYAKTAMLSGLKEPGRLNGLAQKIEKIKPLPRRLSSLAMLLVGGAALFFAIGPFSEDLLLLGKAYGVERFIMIQWLAPLASVSARIMVGIILAFSLKPEAGLQTLITSVISQWTLLLGAIPLIYSLALGEISPLRLDTRQCEEMFLVAAQTLFALIIIMDLKITWRGASVIFGFFVIQFFIPNPIIRYVVAASYIICSIITISRNRIARNGIKHTLRYFWKIPRQTISKD